MNKTFPLFITGIDTEVGKTVISAIIIEAMGAAYWKPVQCGDLSFSDSDKIKKWTSIKATNIQKEAYRLEAPMSPHAAAEKEDVEINLDHFQVPEVDAQMLVIEGAGGLYVPLNGKDCMIDLMQKIGAPVILVSKNYLGSINHTLLSINALKERNIPIAGIIFNGEETPTTQSIIEQMGDVPIIGRVEQMEAIDLENIRKEANKIHRSLMIKLFGVPN